MGYLILRALLELGEGARKSARNREKKYVCILGGCTKMHTDLVLQYGGIHRGHKKARNRYEITEGDHRAINTEESAQTANGGAGKIHRSYYRIQGKLGLEYPTV